MRCLLLFAFSLLLQCAEAQNDPKEIRAIHNTLSRWNNAIRDRNLEKALSVFDSTDRVLLVGSDSLEVMHGYNGVRRMLHGFFSSPNRAYWDLGEPLIEQYRESAWIFVSGHIIVQEKGKLTRTPYRISISLIRKRGVWKWTLFHGSTPAD